MKRILTLLFLLAAAGCEASNVATITLSFTNTVGQPDTNLVKLIPVGFPILANGGFITRGPAILCYPTTNGIVTTNLSQGNYLATNSYLAQGFLFAVPAGTNSYTIGVNLKPISGFNTYNYTPGVNLITSTNSSVNVIMGPNGVADLSISNISVSLAATAIGAVTATNFVGVLSITNVPAATNAINSTNFWGILSATNLPPGLSSSNYIGKFTGDASGLTNFPAGASSTNAVNATNFWGLLSPTNLPPGLASSNYVGSFAGTGSGITNVPSATNAQISVLATNAMLATNAISSGTATNGALTGFASVTITNSGNLQSSNLNVTAVLTASNLVGRAYSDLFKSTNLLASGIAPTNGSAGQFMGWTPGGGVWTNVIAAANSTNTFYASTNGSPSNPGTRAAPWDLATALANSVAYGTIVLLDGGPYPAIDLNASKHIGLRIIADHKWQAFFSGNSINYQTEFGVSNCVLSGVRMLWATNYNIQLAAGAVIDNCWIAGSGRPPGWTTNSNTDGASGVYQSRWAVTNSPTVIQYSLIESNGNFIGADHGLYLSSSNTIVRGNVIRYNLTYGCQISSSFTDAGGIGGDLIYDNLIYGNGTGNGGRNCLVIDCNNGLGTVVACTNWVFNNTLLNNNLFPVVPCYNGTVYFTNNIIVGGDGGGYSGNIDIVSGVGYADYNLATNSFSGSGAVDGGHNIVVATQNLLSQFVNTSNGLWWLAGASSARNAAANQPPGGDFFGNPQLGTVRDIGAFQYDGVLATDTRTNDPSSAGWPDYWTRPALGDVSVKAANVVGAITSSVYAAIATNLVSGATLTNPAVQVTSAGNVTVSYGNGNQALLIDHFGNMFLQDTNGSTVLQYSAGGALTDLLELGTESGFRMVGNGLGTQLFDQGNGRRVNISTNRVDVNTNLNAWSVNVTNALTVSGTITGTVVSATSATLGSLATTSQSTNQLGLSTFTNTTPLVILETDSKGTVVGASNILDTQLSGTVALTTNNNLFSGTSNYFGSLTSFGKPVRADSLLVTNGITNSALTANTVLYVDANKAITSVPNGTAGQYLTAGTPPVFTNIQGSQVSGSIASPALASGAQGTNNVFWTDANHSNALFVTGSWITMSNAAGTVQWNGGNQTNSGPIQATQFLGPNGQVVIGGAQQLSAGYAVTSAGATLTASSGFQGGQIIQPTIQMSGSGGFAALQVSPSIVTTGSGVQDIQEWLNTGTVVARIDINGNQTNAGSIKANNFIGNLSGNASSATTATTANSAGVSSTMVAGSLVTNTVTQILGSSGGQSSAQWVYPNALAGMQLTTNGTFSIYDLNDNPIFLYSGAPYASEAVTIGKDNGFIMFSDRNSTKIYDGSGNTKITVATNQVSLATNTAVVGALTYWRNVLSKTSNYAVQVADCGSTLNNNGTANPVTNTLPAAWIGGTYRGSVAVAQTFALKASGSDTIACIGVASSGGGLIFSATPRASIDLECQTPGQWTVVGGSTNFWTFQ